MLNWRLCLSELVLCLQEEAKPLFNYIKFIKVLDYVRLYECVNPWIKQYGDDGHNYEGNGKQEDKHELKNLILYQELSNLIRNIEGLESLSIISMVNKDNNNLNYTCDNNKSRIDGILRAIEYKAQFIKELTIEFDQASIYWDDGDDIGNFRNLKVLNFKQNTIDFENVVKLIKKTNYNLLNIKLTWRVKRKPSSSSNIYNHNTASNHNNLFDTITKYCPNLNYISLQINNETFRDLFCIFKSCKNLKNVDLNSEAYFEMKIWDISKDMKEFGQVINVKSLIKVKFDSRINISNDGIKDFLQSVEENFNLNNNISNQKFIVEKPLLMTLTLKLMD
ncbi:17542_t:CDS:2 [Entrophospora sp. SA101]|nr:17542_t:CDS:2 [Entrophospora sp. SA101]